MRFILSLVILQIALATQAFAKFKTILVTGGAGYIGSHVSVLLLEQGYHIVIVDNLSNSSIVAVDRVKKLTGKTDQEVTFYQQDLRDTEKLQEIFKKHSIDAVIHFAGLKAVSDSIKRPLPYFDENLTSTFSLLKAMEKSNCNHLIFSSSAAVYGLADDVPFREDHSLSPTNPYGDTKLIIEGILRRIGNSNYHMNTIALRYFNPVGAHPSGMIGEDPNGIPTNLMPVLLDAATGKKDVVPVFGDQFKTRDGTGVRDFIHVMDLASGHIAAMNAIEKDVKRGGPHETYRVYNLGTGRGTTVMEMIHAVGKANGKPVPYVVQEPRPGDVPESFSNPGKAEAELGWKAVYNHEDMARDALNWVKQNPNGYRDEEAVRAKEHAATLKQAS